VPVPCEPGSTRAHDEAAIGIPIAKQVVDRWAESHQPWSAPVSFVEPEVEQSPLPPILLIVGAVLAAILARWRAIILLSFLLLAIWLAFQVLVLARSAFSFVNDNLARLSEEYKQLPSVHIPQVGLSRMSPSRPVTTCWRDRSLAAGDCFRSGGLRRQSRPERLRMPEPPPPGRPRYRNCGPGDDERSASSAEEHANVVNARYALARRQTV
jgi:hypothetical protein